MVENFFLDLEYLDCLKIHFPALPMPFCKFCSKKNGLNIWAPIPIQRYENKWFNSLQGLLNLEEIISNQTINE